MNWRSRPRDSFELLTCCTRWLRRVCAGGVLIAVGACAGVPSQEMSDARRAMDAAVSADAQLHAPQVLQRGRSALADAESALASADYDTARQQALGARAAAIEARFLAREMAETLAQIGDARQAGRSGAPRRCCNWRARPSPRERPSEPWIC